MELNDDMNRETILLKHYPYIVAWGKLLGSFGYYIENQVARAIIDNAPKDSICFMDKTGWLTTEKAKPDIVAELKAYIKGEKGGVIIHWNELEDIDEPLKSIYANG